MSQIGVALDVPAQMRDGVVLRANVYRPTGTGSWPTLLARTPYDKNDHRQFVWCGLDPIQTARRGFVVVVQDTRGRFASDGDWEPFLFEASDGFDTVEWAARLPGSNGRVGMFSASYCANAQWLAAAGRPPALGAIAPALTWADPSDGLFSRGGAVELGLALRWALENGFDAIRRTQPLAQERGRRFDAIIDEWDRAGEDAYWQLPVAAMPALQRHGIPDLGIIRALTEPDLYERSRVTSRYHDVDVPSYHMGGWYDIFAQGALDNYVAMAADGKHARLIVGPWTHHAFADPIGAVLFGMRAARNGGASVIPDDWSEIQLSWFRRQLTTQPVELPSTPVRIFVMGRNQWREETGWPPTRAVTQRWFLHADETLRRSSPPAGADPAEFMYDPAEPVPTLGGNGVLTPGFVSGPLDQTPIEARQDLLVFTSAALQDPLEVTGRVTAVLHVQSSARSTDWVARLCDVHPDGRSINLCDGIVRVVAGADRLARHEIDLWSTSNVFLPGHRLRVHVTSSSFPRWDRNLNTGDQSRPRHQTARQFVSLAPAQPSFIELPVLPETTT